MIIIETILFQNRIPMPRIEINTQLFRITNIFLNFSQ